jgi:hypothetical protein
LIKTNSKANRKFAEKKLHKIVLIAEKKLHKIVLIAEKKLHKIVLNKIQNRKNGYPHTQGTNQGDGWTLVKRNRRRRANKPKPTKPHSGSLLLPKFLLSFLHLPILVGRKKQLKTTT